MAAKKPVIAFNVGSSQEIVVNGHTGFLVEPGDVAAFAAHTEELISHPEQRTAFGKNGRKRVVFNFVVQHR